MLEIGILFFVSCSSSGLSSFYLWIHSDGMLAFLGSSLWFDMLVGAVSALLEDLKLVPEVFHFSIDKIFIFLI